MKKFFSLFAAVLFAGSMMAGTVTFTSSDFAGQGTSGGTESGSKISATKSGVTVSCTNGYGASESFRCYAGSTLSVTSSETIIKISFATTGGKDGGLPANVDVNSKSYSVTMTSQGRITQLVVSLDGDAGEEGGEEGGEGGEEGGEEQSDDVISCATAAEMALSDKTNQVTVEGYVTEIVESWSSQHKNISFWMADTKNGGRVFEAFRVACVNETDAPAVGDKVKVTGTLKKYTPKGGDPVPETEAGGSFEIVEKGEGSGEGGEGGEGGEQSDALLNIDFTKGIGNWTINDVNIGELEYVWKQDNQYGMKATAYVGGTNNASESWLISPAIDLSNVTEATLAISHARRFGELSQLSVQATKDGQNWEKLTVSAWPDGSNWNYIDATADMSNFVGEASVKIALVYTSSTSAAATWEVKTVKVFAGEAPVVKTTFDSFEELIEADFSEKTTVTVSFENLKITGLYYSESGAKYCGIFLDVKAKNDKDIEIYFKNEALPETWKEGGKVSGTITGEWSHYVNESKNQDVWEIVPTETGWSWTKLTYTEDQTAVENTIADTKAVKIVRDGQIYIFRDGQLYNLTGAAVK